MSRTSQSRILSPTCAPPTPSGAAELAVPDRADWKATLEMLDARLRAAAGKQTQMRRRQLQSLSERLSVRTPVRYIAEKRLVLDTLTERLQGTVPARLAHERQQLRTAQDRLLAAGREICTARDCASRRLSRRSTR